MDLLLLVRDVLDVFSRYAVGLTVQHRETAEIAKALIAQACEQQQVEPATLTVHADRGCPCARSKSCVPARRPRHHEDALAPLTSTGNPHSEASFKTLKYRPEFPERFDSIEQARVFCRSFFAWYNHAHRPSGIGLMTPAAVRYGRAIELHAARARVLDAVYAARPERFVRGTPKPPTLPTAAWINRPRQTRLVPKSER